MKRLFVVLGIAAVLCGFAGCSSGDSSEESAQSQASANTEYTLTFNLNIPKRSDEYKITISENEKIPSMKGTSFERLTLPSSSCSYLITLDSGLSTQFCTEGKFSKWNTKRNGEGQDYEAGSEIILQQDLTLYAVYSENTDVQIYSEDGLDFSKNTTYKMKVGETVFVRGIINGKRVSLSIVSNEDAVKIDGHNVEAIGIGTAVLCVRSSDGDAYYCNIEVSSDSSGTKSDSLESMLVGTWKCSGTAYGMSYSGTIVLNRSGRGHVTGYTAGRRSCNSDVDWSVRKSGSDVYLTLENGGSYIGGGRTEFTISDLTSESFKLKQMLFFGCPADSEWTKR